MIMTSEHPMVHSRPLEDYLAVLARLILAGLFIYSAWQKLLDPLSFMIKVNEYEILPAVLEEPFAYIAPWVMVISSVLLILGLGTRLGGGALGLLLISFLIAIGVNIYRDRVLGCGCFSEEGAQVGFGLLFQDMMLLGLAAYLVWRGGGKLSVDSLLPFRLFAPGRKNHPD